MLYNIISFYGGIILRRLLIIALLFCFLPISCTAVKEEGFYTEMPEFLRITQSTETRNIRENVRLRLTKPASSNSGVDRIISDIVDGFAEKYSPLLPDKKQKILHDLDIAPVIFRTGTRWISFLTISRLSVGNTVTSLDYDSRVYDMKTGRRIMLTDIFPDDSDVWVLISDRVREQLSSCFPDETADPAVLDSICSIDSLKSADFSLSAARLMLTWNSDMLYPGHGVLLHAFLYYPEIRPYMTKQAFRQTDNSKFRMVALTYDDGPSPISTVSVLNWLREFGQSATFFEVGFRLEDAANVVKRQYDSGCSIQSHGWLHKFSGDYSVNDQLEWKELFDQTLKSIIGIGPSAMRSAGGKEIPLARMKIGYPLINWSLISGDALAEMPPVGDIARRVYTSVRDGDIVLLHDLKSLSPLYTKEILAHLTQMGVMCVTIEELFSDAGVTLKENLIYHSALEEPETPD